MRICARIIVEGILRVEAEAEMRLGLFLYLLRDSSGNYFATFFG